jgi:hypothetical protein
MKKILLGLTTATNWRGKINEIDEYGIKELSLFPTMLDKEDRKELYNLLEKSSIRNIPHVHLRNDMDVKEMDFFVARYYTKIFNIHPNQGAFPFNLDYSKYAKIIFVENVDTIPAIKELTKYGGLCIDFSHWEDGILKKDFQYSDFLNKARRFKIGCGHISAVQDKLRQEEDPRLKGFITYTSHILNDLSELDYIKKYKEFLPLILSIELENSFKEQLEIKKYLEKIIL